MVTQDQEVIALRKGSVVKANELIQRSRFNLSLQQQKIVLYLISQITPADTDFKLYEFSIKQFCEVCGIDVTSGKNYSGLKAAIKDIADKSIWVTLDDGRETLLRWIEKPYIDYQSGLIKIRLDRDMMPYLLQLNRNFTKYELVYTLRFKSKYSIRLYEIIKSVHFDERAPYTKDYSLNELRTLMGAENHKTYQHFKDHALTPAITEVNANSDKTVSFTTINKGKRVIGISLTIETKDVMDRLQIRGAIEEEYGIKAAATGRAEGQKREE